MRIRSTSAVGVMRMARIASRSFIGIQGHQFTRTSVVRLTTGVLLRGPERSEGHVSSNDLVSHLPPAPSSEH
jgi:hypothetical protein